MGQTLHLNPESQLPPVDCPLLIDVEGELLQARRTSFVERRDLQLEYELEDGRLITGRFMWTYP